MDFLRIKGQLLFKCEICGEVYEDRDEAILCENECQEVREKASEEDVDDGDFLADQADFDRKDYLENFS